MSQRLSHVAHSLGGLGRLLGDADRLFDPEQWATLQRDIRKEYSTAEEIALFDALMQGAPTPRAGGGRAGGQGDVELF